MADPNRDTNNCDEQRAAADAADRLVDRLQDEALDGLKPGSDPVEAVGDIVGELETAPEVDTIRRGAGQPRHWGTRAHRRR